MVVQKKADKLRVIGCILADREAAANPEFLAEMRWEYTRDLFLHKPVHDF